MNEIEAMNKSEREGERPNVELMATHKQWLPLYYPYAWQSS